MEYGFLHRLPSELQTALTTYAIGQPHITGGVQYSRHPIRIFFPDGSLVTYDAIFDSNKLRPFLQRARLGRDARMAIRVGEGNMEIAYSDRRITLTSNHGIGHMDVSLSEGATRQLLHSL